MLFTNLVTFSGVLSAGAGGIAVGQTFTSSAKAVSMALCVFGFSCAVWLEMVLYSSLE